MTTDVLLDISTHPMKAVHDSVRPGPTNDIARHSRGTRLVHWAMALCFITAMVTGLALYWRSILGWLLPLFGGKEPAVNLHYWSGVALTAFTIWLYYLWRHRMRWTAADSHFVRHIRHYALRSNQMPPPETGFFNGGQKLYFWSVVASGATLFGTGLVWWFRKDVPHSVYVVCRTTHRVLGVIAAGALLIHLYKATIGEPGTLRSMLKGTVTATWARTRRPQWFREIGGRD